MFSFTVGAVEERTAGSGAAIWGTSVWGSFNWGDSGATGGDWHTMLPDGLGSVRNQFDEASGSIGAAQVYDPYGQVFNPTGTMVGAFGFTGEQTDENGRWLSLSIIREVNACLQVQDDLEPVRSELQAGRMRWLHYLAQVAGLLSGRRVNTQRRQVLYSTCLI